MHECALGEDGVDVMLISEVAADEDFLDLELCIIGELVKYCCQVVLNSWTLLETGGIGIGRMNTYHYPQVESRLGTHQHRKSSSDLLHPQYCYMTAVKADQYNPHYKGDSQSKVEPC